MNNHLFTIRDYFDRRPGGLFATCMLISFTATWFKLWILAVIPLVLATPLYVVYIAYGWHVHFRVFGLVIYFGLIGLLIHTFACIYQDIGLMYGDQQITSRADAIYFSIVTWTTLGYGDLHPVPQARLWAAAEALLGYIYMGILIALLTSIIGWKSPRQALQDEMIKLSKPPYVIGPFPDPPVPDVDSEGLMVPPWVKYPNIPFGSFGWHVANIGELYRKEFDSWWSRQVRQLRLRVCAKYPEPESWSGFYQRLREPERSGT